MVNIEREVIVIGAGPAGLSAAIEAAKAGCQVLLVDENFRPGGQLFKQTHKFFGSAEAYAGQRGFEIAKDLAAKAEGAGVELWLNTVAYGIFNEGVGLVKDNKGYMVKASKVIVAAGGGEDSVAFPGSTLPGIMLAGAAQTMMNVYRTKPGKRAVVLGSGNVGLILAYQLMQAGVEVAAVVEKADKIGGYMVHAAKVERAGVPVLTGKTVVCALGDDCLNKVVVAKPDGSEEEVIEADLLCIAVGMSPLTELLWQAGAKFDYIAELGGFVPVHDSCMKTTVENLYAAGDVAGVEEATIAIEEGRLAGISVAEATGHIDAEKAEALRAEVMECIAALEDGEQGQARKVARHKQLHDMEEHCRKE